MTAVEWLIEQIITDHNKNALTRLEWMKVFKQAKEMEKQMVIDIVEKSRATGLTAEYLLLTYGSKGSDEHHEDNLEEIISKAHTNITRRKGKEYAPTSNEIQAEIEKSEKPIIPTSSQTEISDEEIEKAFTVGSGFQKTVYSDRIEGAKWYREQLRQRK